MDRSLKEKMEEAFSLAVELVDSKRTLPEEIEEEAHAWIDGLWNKYVEKRISGKCSLKEMISFDVVEFEESVEQTIENFKTALIRKEVRAWKKR